MSSDPDVPPSYDDVIREDFASAPELPPRRAEPSNARSFSIRSNSSFDVPAAQRSMDTLTPADDDDKVWFSAVDEDDDGLITAAELRCALLNDNGRPFNEETCGLMVSMFDVSGDGKVNVHEFAALKRFVVQWRQAFFDQDISGDGVINAEEFALAIVNFGLPPFSRNTTEMIIRRYAQKPGRNRAQVDDHGEAVIHLDDFIQACVKLKIIFRRFSNMTRDPVREPVTLTLENFLDMSFETVYVPPTS